MAGTKSDTSTYQRTGGVFTLVNHLGPQDLTQQGPRTGIIKGKACSSYWKRSGENTIRGESTRYYNFARISLPVSEKK